MSRLTSESLSASHYFETPSSTLNKYYEGKMALIDVIGEQKFSSLNLKFLF